MTEGNYDALGNVYLCRKLAEHIGMEPERLRLEWIAASEGSRFAEVMSGFVDELRGLGPLGLGEGLGRRLDAVDRLVPWLKLVERERLRVPTRSEEAYEAFWGSDEVDRLLSDLVADKLAISQILMLLEEGPLSTGELAERLGYNPSDVSRHMISSSRQGLVRYDVEQKCYALA